VTAETAIARLRESLGVEATGEDPKRPLDLRHLVTIVPVERWVEALTFARDALGCRYFCHLTAVDWKAEGFEVVCRVENLETHLGLTLKARIGRQLRLGGSALHLLSERDRRSIEDGLLRLIGLEKNIAGLEATAKLFALWHTLHVPLIWLLVVTVMVHMTAIFLF